MKTNNHYHGPLPTNMSLLIGAVLRRISLIAIALGLNTAQAQFGPIQLPNLGVGVTIAETIMIQPGSPPILLAGFGDMVVYELLITGPSSDTLQLQYADALTGGIHWNAVTDVTVGSVGYVTVNVSPPFGAFYLYQVVVSNSGGGGGGGGFTPDSTRWAQISPGSFTMGSPDTEYDRSSDEGPQTQVSITHGFWIGKYELTQGEYKAVTGQNNSSFMGDDNQPVEQVSWYDATNYCGMRTAQEHGAGTLPANYVYRLPTEAEWEYTTRAGTTTRFFYGDDDHTYSQLPNYAWFQADSNGSTHDVGQKQGNQWGLFDTSGNVFEWCADLYGPYSGGSVTDPQGPIMGSNRVMRGGSWRFAGGDARSAARNFNAPDFASFGIGFRVVLSQTQ